MQTDFMEKSFTMTDDEKSLEDDFTDFVKSIECSCKECVGDCDNTKILAEGVGATIMTSVILELPLPLKLVETWNRLC